MTDWGVLLCQPCGSGSALATDAHRASCNEKAGVSVGSGAGRSSGISTAAAFSLSFCGILPDAWCYSCDFWVSHTKNPVAGSPLNQEKVSATFTQAPVLVFELGGGVERVR